MRKRKVPLNFWRRLSQVLFFSVFLFLFIKTDYDGSDELAYAVNILFRIDPLLAACAMLAGKLVISLMLPALVTVILTLLLGRSFCGWFCPMGALLDLVHRFFRPAALGAAAGWRSIKYGLLVFVLAGAFSGLPVAGYVDPFSILVRGLAVSVYPAANKAATAFFTFTYNRAPEWINLVTEPAYAFLRHSVLPFSQKYYTLALFSLFILLTVFLLEKIERRFFCRNICPLGGLLSILANFALLRGTGGTKKCGKCKVCRTICRMDAIAEDRTISAADCNLCLDCVDLCPADKISFTFRPPAAGPLNFSRRALLGSLAAGAVLPLFLGVRASAKHPDPALVRPPGALPEDEFLGRCVRCGECMKVCIGNGLQPTFLQAGLEGMFSPHLLARTGYCEYNCTLCGQVCPSGAIAELTLPEKQQAKMGNVSFDKNRCLPYAKAVPCIVCEEHCPTPDKAIKFREAEVVNSSGETVVMRQPYLVDELCIGCGICEYKCPLPGRAAVILTSAGESRNPDNSLPEAGSSFYP